MPKADDNVLTEDWAQYRDSLKAYYDARAVSPELEDGAGNFDVVKFREQIRDQHTARDWRFAMIEHLRRAMAGRNVVELGCGSGYWTHHLSEVAASVLATDVSERVLANARRAVDCASVDFQLLDATHIARLQGSFDALVSVNMINHFPRKVAVATVEDLNERLGEGARVFIAGEHYYGWRRRMYRKPGSTQDFVSARVDSKGESVEVVDDPYEPADILRLIGGRARDVYIGDCLGYWWARYTVDREEGNQ